ncbi:NAD-dependent epimerase/dehydratase family protein [Alphaproteobacteria bacterium]|nr:NAD-dependent epimerase/dehydratase family protein [Alphaproteobacteria bacterium]
MIIAITGGTGFIGNLLVNKHLDQGDQVRLLSRKINPKRKGITYVIGDLSNPNINFYNFLDEVDILYHCAGEVNNQYLMKELHVNGTQKLIDEAQGKIGRWVQLSSVGAYGEYRNGIITENSVEKPIKTYEKTKTESDHIVINSGIPFVILRPSSVFGNEMPNQSLRDLLYVVRKGLFFFIGKKNNFFVNYIHVDEVIDVLMNIGTNSKALGEVFNLSQSTTVESMIATFLSEVTFNKKIFRLPERTVRLIVSVLGWIPKFPLTSSRVDALTNKCIYSSTKIQKKLRFNYSMTLEERLKLFAKQK